MSTPYAGPTPYVYPQRQQQPHVGQNMALSDIPVHQHQPQFSYQHQPHVHQAHSQSSYQQPQKHHPTSSHPQSKIVPQGYQSQMQQTYPPQQLYQTYPMQQHNQIPVQQTAHVQAPSQQAHNVDYFSTFNQQIGMQIGSQAFHHGEEIVKQNLNKYVSLPLLKYYFNVSNSYVLYKIQILLFPFRHKSWARLVKRSEMNGQMEGFKPPREDLNAPDLYIPVMSLVTYVLVVGLYLGSGVKNTFTPDVLGMTATKALFTIFFEVLLMKLGCYVLNVQSNVPILDLVAYSGYQFIGLIGTIVTKMGTENAVLYTSIVFGYTMICFAFVLLRSMKYIIFPEMNSTTISASQNPNRKGKVNFLFITVGIQIFMAYILLA